MNWKKELRTECDTEKPRLECERIAESNKGYIEGF